MSSAGSAPVHWPARAVIQLARQRLRRASGARAGAWGALGVVLVSLGGGAWLVDADPAVDLTELVRSAVVALLWLGAGPLALSIANQRAARDRADGIELLALLRGHRPGALGLARAVAAVERTTVRLALPAVALCGALATFAWQSSGPLLVQALGLSMFAVVAGLGLGGLAALCGHYGGRRGWGWLLALVLLPWAVGEQLGRPECSLPGALDHSLVVLADPSWVGVNR